MQFATSWREYQTEIEQHFGISYVSPNSFATIYPHMLISQQEPTRRLRVQAKEALRAARMQNARGPVRRNTEQDNELDRLGGKTQLVARRAKTPSSNGNEQSSTSNSLRSSFSPDRRMEENWESRAPSNVTVPWWPSSGMGEGSSSQGYRGVTPLSTGGSELASESFLPPPGQGLDAAWHSFIQQLGF